MMSLVAINHYCSPIKEGINPYLVAGIERSQLRTLLLENG